MLTLGLVIALVIDRIIPSLQSYRKEYSLSHYFRWVEKNCLFKDLPPRLTPLVLILPALLVVVFVSAFFEVTLLVLVFYIFVAYVCLEPQALNEEVDVQLRELGRIDSERTQSAGELFSRANRSLYTVIFWFVVLGPTMAVTYRLLEQVCSQRNLNAIEVWKSGVIKLVAWFEWLPTLISSFLFLIGGNFEAGLKQTRNMPIFDANLQALNANRLQQVGKASLLIEGNQNEHSEHEFIRRSRGLLLRTLVLWLVLAALIDYWL